MTMTNVDRVMHWRHQTKRRLIEAFGGSCAICGYDRCDRALEFHHLDPSNKETSWGELNGQIRSFATIVKELTKCVMLCSNCHKEVHAGVVEVPEHAVRIAADYDYRPAPFSELDPCNHCGAMKSVTWSACKRCLPMRKVNWLENDVVALVTAHGSYEAVGRLLNVTGQAVRRQYRKETLV
jgi:hypothetical protein